MTGVPLAGTPLTDRECEVLVLVAGGLTYYQIGRRIHLSVPGVKARVWRATQKLGAANTAQALYIAAQRKLLGDLAPSPYPCGTSNAYWWHVRHDQPRDDACLAAHAKERRDQRHRESCATGESRKAERQSHGAGSTATAHRLGRGSTQI